MKEILLLVLAAAAPLGVKVFQLPGLLHLSTSQII
jgi:hypothetical protein